MTARERLTAGLALHQQGRLDDAEAAYKAVLAGDPDNADAYHFLGLIAQQRGDTARACELISRAVELDEPRPTFHLNLGIVLAAVGRDTDAIPHFRRAAGLDPDEPDARLHLAAALGRAGAPAEAEAAYRAVLERDAKSVPALAGLAAALNNLARHADAAAFARRALEIEPGHLDALVNLANAQRGLGALDDAEMFLTDAAARHPASALAHYNLANVVRDLGRPADAEAHYRASLAADPAYRDAADNLLMCLLYDPAQTEESLYAEHRALAMPDAVPAPTFANAREPGRRLRVGYVSADFRTHSCAYFAEPLFAAHDRAAVEVFAYANVRASDATTERLQALCDHWRDIRPLDDGAGAAQIRTDGIDILVDLSGHSAGNRLGLFAKHPAPVQATWLGYPATTGMEAIGYRLTDAVADPDSADRWHTENLVRLPDGFLCHRPPADAPGVIPRTGGDPIAFGSFNNLAKVTPEVVAAWAAILAAVPDARLVLKGRLFDFADVRARYYNLFAEHGIGGDRLDLIQWIPRDDNPLAAYERIDIGLDPFPYNGTTTTCEALWMGVPVVTLAGGRHAGRVGASLLTQIGAPELVAPDTDAYVRLAAELAGDRDRLAAYRRDLRARIEASPLRDEAAFAGKMEAAYREMWRAWCQDFLG